MVDITVSRNLHSPMFTKDGVHLSLPDNTTPGSVITQLKATDNDRQVMCPIYHLFKIIYYSVTKSPPHFSLLLLMLQLFFLTLFFFSFFLSLLLFVYFVCSYFIFLLYDILQAPNNEIEYRINGDVEAQTFFYINPVSGDITLVKSLLQYQHRTMKVFCLYTESLLIIVQFSYFVSHIFKISFCIFIS